MKTRTFTTQREVTILATFEVEVEPGEKGTPRTMGDPGTPDWPASACVIGASVGDVQIPLDAIDRRDIGAVEDEAIEVAIDAEADAYEAAMEDRADAAREDRLLGLDR